MKGLLAFVATHGTWFLLAAVWLLFACMTDKFLTIPNLMNIGVQSSSTAIVATGMTLVLLTGGVDLSLGSIMFVAAAVAGKLAMMGIPMYITVPSILSVGLLCAAVNGLLITRLMIVPFIATLGTLYVGRGLGLWLTETRAMNLPEAYLQMGSASWLYIPIPIWILGTVLVVFQLTLTWTPFGRWVMAIGNNHESAMKAGIPTNQIIMIVYLLSGGLASVGAIVSLSQLGAVSPTFGENREFTAIAAAVLGGTSLFGGRGTVFPGALLGAVLIQSVENGLVLINADPYFYPLVVSTIIFAAVLLDGGRTAVLQSLQRRKIFYQYDA